MNKSKLLFYFSEILDRVFFPAFSILLFMRFLSTQIDLQNTNIWLGRIIVPFFVVIFLMTSRRPQNIHLSIPGFVGLVLINIVFFFELDFYSPQFQLNLWNSKFLSYLVTFYLTCLALAYVNLGRSVSALPVFKQIRTSGFFRLCRHPVYSGLIHEFLLFTIAFPTLKNISFNVLFIFGTWLRIRDEEKIMSANSTEYTEYVKSVRFQVFHPLYTIPLALFALSRLLLNQ